MRQQGCDGRAMQGGESGWASDAAVGWGGRTVRQQGLGGCTMRQVGLGWASDVAGMRVGRFVDGMD